MKKLNKNSLLFVFAIIFMLAGIWGDCFEQLKLKTIDILAGLKNGNAPNFVQLKADVDDICNKELSYHATLMGINSVKENLLGTKVIQKDDIVVVKSASGSLTEPREKINEDEIKTIVSKIQELKIVSEENGANFLYCVAPTKELYEVLPSNVENSCELNYNQFISQLIEADIPTLDLSVSLKDDVLQDSNMFYYTDHHWTVKTGFWATKDICSELESRYNFKYDKELTDISNYTTNIYSDCFLGSKGKKVGEFFTWHGADDFELITPKFDTNLTEKQPFKDKVRKGSFDKTVLYMENMKKALYEVNTYTTYSGGDFRLQIVENNLKSNGKKVLLIRDSFAGVVAPFLALQTGEIHICDMRDYEYYVGDKINAEKYIKELKPDYVIVLYNGVTSLDDSHSRYNFF